jgi:tetratricopeptide (TPR) repeat protein
MMGGDVEAADQLFVQACDKADGLPALFSERSRFHLHQLQAYADMRLGRWDQANAELQDQLNHLTPLFGPKDPDVLLAEYRISQVQMERGQNALAAASAERIRPDVIDTFGPEHRVTLQLLGTEGQALFQSGQYAEAVPLFLQMHEAAAAKQGDQSFMAVAALASVAETRCRAGEADNGVATATSALANAVAGLGSDSVVAQSIRSTLAFCLIVNKRDAEAAKLLNGINRNALAQFASDPDFSAGIDLMQAQIAIDTGDRQTFASKLVEPMRAFERADADVYMRKWTEKLMSLSPETVPEKN